MRYLCFITVDLSVDFDTGERKQTINQLIVPTLAAGPLA